MNPLSKIKSTAKNIIDTVLGREYFEKKYQQEFNQLQINPLTW